jgi:hypothetical protein
MDTKIFATRSDLISGIEQIESQRELYYANTDFDKPEDLKALESLQDCQEIGYNTTGKYITGLTFLVVDRKYNFNIEKIKQNKGGYLYSIDQSNNPYSIMFQPGGMYNETCLIRGTIATISDAKESRELYRFFSKTIIKNCKRIKGWYIGPEAMKLAKSGTRLITMHASQDPIYDLTLTSNVL